MRVNRFVAVLAVGACLALAKTAVAQSGSCCWTDGAAGKACWSSESGQAGCDAVLVGSVFSLGATCDCCFPGETRGACCDPDFPFSAPCILLVGIAEINCDVVYLGTYQGDGSFCSQSGNQCNPCGDGVFQPGEECDDGNIDNGDGCDADCLVEPGFSCKSEPSVCDVCQVGAVPAIGAWGLLVMVLLLIGAGSVVFRRMRAA